LTDWISCCPPRGDGGGRRGVFSPEGLDSGEGEGAQIFDGSDTGASETPESIGQFKLMQLRLASQLQLKPTDTDKKEAVAPTDKIGQSNLMRLMLASRLQFKEAPQLKVRADCNPRPPPHPEVRLFSIRLLAVYALPGLGDVAAGGPSDSSH